MYIYEIIKKFWRDIFWKQFLPCRAMWIKIGRERIIIWTNLYVEDRCDWRDRFTKLTRRSGRLLAAVRNEREPNRSLKAKYHRLPAISFQVLSGIWLETGGIRSRAFSKLAKLPTRIGFSSFAPLRNLHDFRSDS